MCQIDEHRWSIFVKFFFFYFRMVEDVKADITPGGGGRPKPAFGPYVCVEPQNMTVSSDSNQNDGAITSPPCVP